jgi:large subunit ribosomal protein L24
MAGMRLRKGDEVMVIAGKDRGKRGRVQEVRPRDLTVIVAGVNIAKRHTKPNPSKNQKGGIVEQPMPLGLGKVMVICPHCGKPTRVAHRTADEDTKERVCKRCGEAIVVEEPK